MLEDPDVQDDILDEQLEEQRAEDTARAESLILQQREEDVRSARMGEYVSINGRKKEHLASAVIHAKQALGNSSKDSWTRILKRSQLSRADLLELTSPITTGPYGIDKLETAKLRRLATELRVDSNYFVKVAEA